MTDSPFAQSEQINELADALAKAQQSIAGAQKGSENPHFKSKYADLADVWSACRQHLTANGLSVVQSPGFDGQSVTMTTLLLHSSGQWVRGNLSIPLGGKITPHTIGSAITYARRYALGGFASVAPEDDDGNKASESPAEPRPPQRQQREPSKIDNLRRGTMKAAKELMSRDPFWDAVATEHGEGGAIRNMREAAGIPVDGQLDADGMRGLKAWAGERLKNLPEPYDEETGEVSE